MWRFLFDTGAFTDYVNKREPTFSRADAAVLQGGRLGVSPPVLGEMYYGIAGSVNPKKTMRGLVQAFRAFIVWPFDESAAQEFGRIAALLKRSGRPMQQIDIQVAAVAFTLGRCTVVTKDSDFSAIPGLKVEDWSK